jgi:hypothetical protein
LLVLAFGWQVALLVPKKRNPLSKAFALLAWAWVVLVYFVTSHQATPLLSYAYTC